MNRTATKITDETRDGEPIYCVQWPRFPKGRNRRYFKEKIEAETFLKRTASTSRGCQSGLCSISNNVALKLCQCPKDMKKQLSAAGARINVFLQTSKTFLCLLK